MTAPSGKAIFANPGAGTAGLQLRDVPIPTPGPGEVLVRLRAATLNYRDHLFAQGILADMTPPEYIPLSCAAGVVETLGEGVSRVRAGDRVSPIFDLGWLTGPSSNITGKMLGGMAPGVARQYACFPQEILVHLPDEMGDLEAATLPCAGITAWSALTQFRPTAPGEWILTHGTGGVSIAALQLAKAMGAKVAITSSSDAKLARAASLGADFTVNYRKNPDWRSVITAKLGARPIANVVDTVGVSQFDDNAALLAQGGQLSAIGMLGTDFSWSRADPGVSVATISTGSRDAHEAMIAFITQHRIRPVVDVVYDLQRLPDAMRHLVSGAFFGKVAVNLW